MQQNALPPSNTAPTMNSNLNDWLNYMHGIHVSAIDMGLERVIPVFERLGIKQTQAFVFTVAGTNGKGSTTATIAAICQAAGYKTALYQSPHLMQFNERVKINGNMVDDATLVAVFAKVEQARLDCGLSLSFFEMTTLAAFLIFSEAHCDVWVLEIGLGGRLDVVNVIDPNLAVITNVGIDHIEWLGDNREQIGSEKAGILREGINLVYGETDMPITIPPMIAEHQAKLLQVGKDFSYHQVGDAGQWQYNNTAVTLSLPTPTLSLHNTSVAITAVLASGLAIGQTDIANALPTVHLAGRFDRRELANRYWLFDVAHNEHGIAFLLRQLVPYWQSHQQQYPQAKLQLVFSMLADKDIDSVLADLATLPINQVVSGEIDHFRASNIERLTQALTQYFGEAHVLPKLDQATDWILAHSEPQDLILVCGSFHTIAEVLAHLQSVEVVHKN